MKLCGKKTVSGYFTLEACLLLPVILFIVVLFVYFSFFTYNNCILAQNSYILGVRANQLRIHSSENAIALLEQEIGKVFVQTYFGQGRADTAIETDRSGIVIKSRGTMQFPFHRLLLNSEIDGAWVINGAAQVYEYNPVEFIRKCRAAGKLIQGGESSGI